MSAEFFYKVSPRGEGKTKWLINVAERESKSSEVFMLTRSRSKYDRFAGSYLTQMSHSCPVNYASSIFEVTPNSVVIIDNLLEENINCKEIDSLKSYADKVYITLEGRTCVSDENLFDEKLSEGGV